MVANPPYGKSWKKDLEAMGGKDGMRDPRFKVMHEGEELSLVTRSSRRRAVLSLKSHECAPTRTIKPLLTSEPGTVTTPMLPGAR